MNSFKKQKTGHKIIGFGDQFIQRIGYYLPLKDKILLLGVNRQFNRCFSQSQRDLVIDYMIGNRFNSLYKFEDKSIAEEKESDDDSDISEGLLSSININNQLLEWILKKFNRIETLDLSNCLIKKQTIDLICDIQSPNLVSLKLPNFGIDHMFIKRLGQTFGNQLLKLKIGINLNDEINLDKLLFNYCPNLTHVFCKSLQSFVTQNALFLSNLKTVSTILDKTEDLETLKIFVDKYKNQMKNMSVFMQLNDTKDCINGLQLISGLNALESIHLNFFDPKTNLMPIDNSIKNIALNCHKINSLELSFNYGCNSMISTDFFNICGLFHNIKKFKCQLLITEDEKSEANNTIVKEFGKFDMRCLKNCNRLICLDLTFSEMDDSFTKDIHIYSPNLVSVHLNSGKELSDLTLESLSQLKRLKCLKISRNYFKKDWFPAVTDSGIKQLFSNCLSIRCVVFRGLPNITQESMDLLITLAQNNANKSYRFECLYRNDDICDEEMINKFDVNSLILPSNLMIKLESLHDYCSEDEDIDSEDSSMESSDLDND